MTEHPFIQQTSIELLQTLLGTRDTVRNKTGSLSSQTHKVTGFLILKR